MQHSGLDFSLCPVDILRTIFASVPLRPLITVISRVCRRWRSVALTSLRSFPPSPELCCPLSEEEVSARLRGALALCPNIELMPQVPLSLVSAECWSSLPPLENLKTITIPLMAYDESPKSRAYVGFLRQLTGITSLQLHYNAPTILSLLGLPFLHFSRLTTLNFQVSLEVNTMPKLDGIVLPCLRHLLCGTSLTFTDFAARHATQLLSLCVTFDQSSGVFRFPALTRLEILGYFPWPILERIQADLPSLKEIHVGKLGGDSNSLRAIWDMVCTMTTSFFGENSPKSLTDLTIRKASYYHSGDFLPIFTPIAARLKRLRLTHLPFPDEPIEVYNLTALTSLDVNLSKYRSLRLSPWQQSRFTLKNTHTLISVLFGQPVFPLRNLREFHITILPYMVTVKDCLLRHLRRMENLGLETARLSFAAPIPRSDIDELLEWRRELLWLNFVYSYSKK